MSADERIQNARVLLVLAERPALTQFGAEERVHDEADEGDTEQPPPGAVAQASDRKREQTETRSEAYGSRIQADRPSSILGPHLFGEKHRGEHAEGGCSHSGHKLEGSVETGRRGERRGTGGNEQHEVHAEKWAPTTASVAHRRPHDGDECADASNGKQATHVGFCQCEGKPGEWERIDGLGLGVSLEHARQVHQREQAPVNHDGSPLPAPPFGSDSSACFPRRRPRSCGSAPVSNGCSRGSYGLEQPSAPETAFRHAATRLVVSVSRSPDRGAPLGSHSCDDGAAALVCLGA